MKLKSGFHETEKYHCLGNLNSDNVELRLLYCGYEDCEPGHRFGPNRRTAYVLHVIVNGKGRLEIGNKTYSLKEGDAFLLRPNEEAWYTADYQNPWKYMWIGFQGIKAEECIVNAGFLNGHSVIHDVNHTILLSYVMEMLSAHSLSYSNSLKRQANLYMFFASLVEQHREHIKVNEEFENEPWAEHAKQLMIHISNHYNQNIRISEIAREMGVNRSYLSSTFKRLTGHSPTEYLIMIRMEKAKSLLTKTNFSIGQIAEAVGYSDQLAFSRMFKHRFGECPREYRADVEQLVICNEKVAPEDALL